MYMYMYMCVSRTRSVYARHAGSRGPSPNSSKFVYACVEHVFSRPCALTSDLVAEGFEVHSPLVHGLNASRCRRCWSPCSQHLAPCQLVIAITRQTTRSTQSQSPFGTPNFEENFAKLSSRPTFPPLPPSISFIKSVSHNRPHAYCKIGIRSSSFTQLRRGSLNFVVDRSTSSWIAQVRRGSLNFVMCK